MDNPRQRSRAPRAAVTIVAVAALGVALGGSAAGSAAETAVGSAAGTVAAGTVAAGTVARAGAVVVAPERAAVLTPVQAGVVPDHLNPGLLAALAREARDAEVRAALRAEPAGEGAASSRDSGADAGESTKTDDGAIDDGAPDDGAIDDAVRDAAAVKEAKGAQDPQPKDVRELAAAVLAELPGGSAVEIAWNHPDIGNHLGGVRLDKPTVMMLNSHRFEAQPERVAATVKHEIGHYYQGAVIAAHAEAAGGWWDAYWQLDAALKPVFGKAWMERSADCVALHLGADWTHYTSDCSSAARKAVKALVAGRMP